jgi:hypothetical protein
MKVLAITSGLVLLTALAGAESLSYSASFGPQPGSSDPVPVKGIKQFDPSLGKLKSVTLKFRDGFEAIGTVSGNGKALKYSWQASLVLKCGALPLINSDGNHNYRVQLTGKPIQRDDRLFSRDGHDSPRYRRVSIRGDWNKLGFVGTGLVPINFVAKSSFGISSGSGAYSLGSAKFQGDFTITYKYQPAKLAAVATLLGSSSLRYGYASANTKGIVCGAVNKGSVWIPALFQDGKLISTGPVFPTNAPALWIRDDGVAIISQDNNNTDLKTCYWWNGKDVKQILVPGFKTFTVSSATTDGKLVGIATKDGNSSHGFASFWYDGTNFKQISVTNIPNIYAQSVNRNGDVLVRGWDDKGAFYCGIWNAGNFKPFDLPTTNFQGAAVNEKGDAIIVDDSGTINIFPKEGNRQKVAAPKSDYTDISSFTDDDLYTGSFSTKGSQSAFVGSSAGYQTFGQLLGDPTANFQQGWYVKNDGELVAMSSKDQAFYVFDQVDVNPATFDFPATVTAGKAASLTLKLSRPAVQDTTFAVDFDQSLASGPSSISVPKGQSSGSISIIPGKVGESTDLDIEVSNSSDDRVLPSSILPTGPSYITVDNNYLPEGQTCHMTLNLNTPAPDGGLEVDLSADNTDFASLPDTVTVPAGATSVSFDVQSYNADANTRVIISARYSIDRITGTFTLHPLRETAFTCDAKTAKAGTIINGTVTLEAPAPANGRLVSISSSSPSISAPTTILIPAGQTTGTFQAKVVGTKKEVVTLQAGTPANSLYWKISLN